MKLILKSFAALFALSIFSPAFAQSTPALGAVVATCGTPPSTYVVGTNRPITQDTTGLQCTGATIAPSGTQDVNVKQINGTTVSTGTGAQGAGSQRVTVATDSATVAGSSSLPAGSNIIGNVRIDQTTPGTTNGVVTNSGSTTAVTQATASNLNAQVQGVDAGGASATAKPVNTGGIYNSTLPTYTNGQRTEAQFGTRGSQNVTLFGQDNNSAIAAQSGSSDGVAAANNGLTTIARDSLFNGTNWDRAFTCTSQAAINVTAGSTTQIVGLSGSTVIRVCNFSISMSAAGTASVLTGTGTNCGTPTTVIQPMSLATGTPLNIVGPGGGSAFRSSAGGEICVAAVTGNVTGYLNYTQY